MPAHVYSLQQKPIEFEPGSGFRPSTGDRMIVDMQRKGDKKVAIPMYQYEYDDYGGPMTLVTI